MAESNRVLLITNIPNPYRIPLFNQLASELSHQGKELVVVFGAKSYKRRLFELNWDEMHFKAVFLRSLKIPLGARRRTFFTYSGLRSALKQFEPGQIIVAGFSLATINLWLMGRPFLIWSGATDSPGHNDSFLRLWLRKKLVAKARGFVVYGARAKSYLEKLGAPSELISIAINTTKTEAFFNLEREPATRPPTILCVGYLTNVKRVDRALKTVAVLRERSIPFQLQIVGDGPERQSLESMVRELRLDSSVSFEGFVQPENLPTYLSNASVFLFPSEYDIYGLAGLEAMASGLPCIISQQVGMTTDLVDLGENGYVVDFDQHNEVANVIGELLSNPDLGEQIGARARQTIADRATIERSVEGFLKVLGASPN